MAPCSVTTSTAYARRYVQKATTVHVVKHVLELCEGTTYAKTITIPFTGECRVILDLDIHWHTGTILYVCISPVVAPSHYCHIA